MGGTVGGQIEIKSTLAYAELLQQYKELCKKVELLNKVCLNKKENDPVFTKWLESNPLFYFITEAPKNGTTYGRKDGEWVEIVTTETDPIFSAWLTSNPFSGYITEAPIDGTTYGRQNGSWTPIVTTETDPLFSAWLLTNPLSGFVPLTREITINGVTYDLSANRSWTVDALPPQAGNNGKVLFTNGASASWEQFDYIQDATPTGTIKVGARWFKTDTGREYTYIDDGTSSQWVEQTLPTATGPTGPSGPNNISTSTTTAINAILKGNGLNVEAAIPNTDYQAPIGYTPEDQANKETVALDNDVNKYPNNNVVKTALDNYLDLAQYNYVMNLRLIFNY